VSIINGQEIFTLNDTLLKGPEGIIYDQETNQYFIANANDGKILTMSTESEINVFAEGFGTAMGFSIVGDSLFISSNSPRLFSCLNKHTGDIIYQINLNDSTVSISQMVYDSRSQYMYLLGQEGCIVKIDIHNASYHMFKKFNQGLVNGSQTIELDTVNNRLFVFSFSSTLVKSLSLFDSTNLESVNCGISKCIASIRDDENNIYVSSWTGSRIWKINPDDLTQTQIFCDDSLFQPAGIAYNSEDEEFVVCNYGGNFLTFIRKNSATDIVKVKEKNQNSYAFYNSTSGSVEVFFDREITQNEMSIQIFDIQGRKIINDYRIEGKYEVLNIQIPLNIPVKGIYLINIRNKFGYIGTSKFIIN